MMGWRILLATCLLLIGVGLASEEPALPVAQLIGFLCLAFVPSLIANHMRRSSELLDWLLGDDEEDDDAEWPGDTPHEQVK